MLKSLKGMILMQIDQLHHLSPFVRLVKISRSDQLIGEWIDYDHVFTYIEQGEAEFILEGVRYQLGAGDAIIMPPLMVHLIQSTSKLPLIQYIVHFDLHSTEQRRKWNEISIKLPEQKSLPHVEKLFQTIEPVSHIQPADQLYMKRRFLTLQQLFTTKPPYSDLQMKGILLELIALFFHNQTQQATLQGKQTRGWASIQLSIHYIYANYHLTSLDREAIAKHVGLSPNHLSYLFKEQLGISIYKFINSIRIDHAKKRILENQLSLTFIAEEVGFSSIYSFSRAFKSAVGMSASQFYTMHTAQSEDSVSNLSYGGIADA